MLKSEPKIIKEKTEENVKREKSKAPCMIVFCEFEQQFYLINLAKQYGLNNYINLVFRKNFSAQVLKANMKVVGNCEYAVIFYRDRLPKFNNNGKMVFNCMDWIIDNESEKTHPTQKPVKLLEKLRERTYTGVIVSTHDSGLCKIKLDNNEFKSFYINNVRSITASGFTYVK
jgi:DNA modification methylase